MRGVKFDKQNKKPSKVAVFHKKMVLEKYQEVLERSLKSPGILYLIKCGNHVVSRPVGNSRIGFEMLAHRLQHWPSIKHCVGGIHSHVF